MNAGVVLLLAAILVATVTAAELGKETPIPYQRHTLSAEERTRLDAISEQQRQLRNARPAIMQNSPHGPHFVNAHLKGNNNVKAQEVITKMYPDDAYVRHRFIHMTAKDGLDVRSGKLGKSYSLLARWSPAAVANTIRIGVNWNDAEAMSGIDKNLVYQAFRDVANEWQSVSSKIPQFRFANAPAMQKPSSFNVPMPIRNGENEFAIFQHDGDNTAGVGHDVLGGVFLWVDKETGYIVEADGYLMLHDHDGEHFQWHVGNGHHHPENNFHMRRTLMTLFGHVLGLSYSDEAGHAMAMLSAPGQPMRLAKGDRDGIMALYT